MIPFAVSFVIWAVLHSLTAAQVTKNWVANIIGEENYQRLYRLVYTLFSLISFLPVAYFYIRLPNLVVWEVSGLWGWLMHALQVVGAVGAAVSVWQTDALSFVGVRQLVNEPSSNEKKQGLGETLYIAGLYRWMRHPLYTFSMMFLWFSPTMTRNSLFFTLLASFYFVVGSVLEERRLTADFGSAYTAYQGKVPRFLPRPWSGTDV